MGLGLELGLGLESGLGLGLGSGSGLGSGLGLGCLPVAGGEGIARDEREAQARRAAAEARRRRAMRARARAVVAPACGVPVEAPACSAVEALVGEDCRELGEVACSLAPAPCRVGRALARIELRKHHLEPRRALLGDATVIRECERAALVPLGPCPDARLDGHHSSAPAQHQRRALVVAHHLSRCLSRRQLDQRTALAVQHSHAAGAAE